MPKEIFNIPNISCGHCVKTIENELEELRGIIGVSGNPDTRNVEVQWEDPATRELILKTLSNINYPAE